MRIRKRPPSSCSSSPSLSPDPPLHVLHPPNGMRHGAKDSTSSGGGGGGQGLHPVGDLPPLIDPHTSPILDPPLSDPFLDEDGEGGRRTSPLLATDQAPKEEDEAWRTTVKFSDRIKWNAQVNRRSGSSGAVVIGREMISLHKKTKGGNEHNGYCGDGGSETDKLMQQEKKAKVQKARASTTTGPALSNNNCTSSTAKDGDKELGYCNGGAAVVRVGRNTGLSATVNGKRRRSPAVLMEGSRCSRVNGRGWRCCQQTLVGYSLCEHHLGKGRLRSMSSVKGQLGTSKPRWSTDGRNGVVPSASPQRRVDAVDRSEGKQSPQSCVAANDGVDKIDEEEEEEEEEMARKKRKKIGMVKARSISSLLDDTNHPPAMLSSQPLEVTLMSPPDHDNKARWCGF